MTDDNAHDRLFGAPIDPIAMARRDLKKPLPRRFWTDVEVGAKSGGYAILLDASPAVTPAKAPLIVPTLALAERIAAEWRDQEGSLDPQTMPLTRLVNTTIDAVAQAMPETAAETAKFAETDLVCYRAEGPDSLVAAQAQAWDPVLAFAHETFGARFVCAQGVMYVAQPEAALAAIVAAVDRVASGDAAPLRLAALSLMTNLMGSVLLALAVAHRRLSAVDAWRAAHVDEDHQMDFWGRDTEALRRREMRWSDMQAAAIAYDLAR